MRVEIKACLKGATSARGVVIVIDVFRAGNTAAALLAAGTPFIMPVEDLEEARGIKNQNPDWLLVGERGGLKPKGCDLNNSPADAIKLKPVGAPVILTTSAGAKGLIAAWPNADELLMASLANAESAAALVRALDPELVTLAPIGLEAREPAVEDDVVAEYLAGLLLGRRPDYRAAVKAILGGPGADRLRRLNQWRDLAFCLRLNCLGIVPWAGTRDGRLVLAAAHKAWRPGP